MKFFKNLRKRGLALFLVLTMCMSLLPTSALAAELDLMSADGRELICGKEAHSHTEECYETVRSLICEAEENHVHSEECYVAGGPVLVCASEEEGHVHGDECYAPGEAVLSCDKVENHVHGEDCYTETKAEIPACGLEEHEHSEECYAAQEQAEPVIPEGAVEVTPAELAAANSGEGDISIYDLFGLVAQAGWENGTVAYGAFVSELTLAGAQSVETLRFEDYVLYGGDGKPEKPVTLSGAQVLYRGQPVVVYFFAENVEEDTAHEAETLAGNPVIDRPTGGANWGTATLVSDSKGLHCLCHEGKHTANSSAKSHAWMKQLSNGRYEIVKSASLNEDLGYISIEAGDISYIHCFGQSDATNSNKGNWKGVSQDIQILDPAEIQISKSASPVTVEVGKDVTYTITVKNIGGSASESVGITDTFLTSGKISAGSITGATVENGVITVGSIPANEERTITYTYTTQESDVGSLINTVSAPGLKDVSCTVEVTEHPVPIPTAPGVPTVGKSADKQTVTKGDVITYTVTIEPTEGAPVDKFTISDTRVSNFTNLTSVNSESALTAKDQVYVSVAGTWTDGNTFTLTDTAGTKEAITVKYTYEVNGIDDVTPKDGDSKVVSNTAKVTVYNGTTPPDGTPPEATKEVPYKEATVGVTKVVSEITNNGTSVKLDRTQTETKTVDGKEVTTTTYAVKPGDVITWTITVTNNSTEVAAKNVNLVDTLKVNGAAATLTSGLTPSNFTFAEGESVTSFTVPVGTPREFTATYKVDDTDTGSIANEAAVNGGNPVTPPTPVVVEKKSVNIEKSVTGMSGTDKTVDGKTVKVAKVGDTLTYTIKVTNNGNVALADLVINDEFKVGGIAVDASKVTVTSNNATANATGGKLTGFTLTAALAAGAEVSITYTYTVAAEDANKTIINVATAGPEDVEDPATPPTTETKVDPLIISNITKELTNDKVTIGANDTSVTLSYKITVEGNEGAKYTVSDAGATLVSGNSWTGTIPASGKVEINVTKTFTVTNGKVNGDITNVAKVTPGDNAKVPDKDGEPQTELTSDPATAYQVSYQYDATYENAPALPATVIVKQDTSVEIAPDATLEGWTFKGWTVKEPTTGVTVTKDDATKKQSFTMPESNVVIEGGFEKDPVIDQDGTKKEFKGVVTTKDGKTEVTSASAVTDNQKLQYAITIKTTEESGTVKTIEIADTKLQELVSVKVGTADAWNYVATENGSTGHYTATVAAKTGATIVLSTPVVANTDIVVTYNYTVDADDVEKNDAGEDVIKNEATITVKNAEGGSNNTEKTEEVPYDEPDVTVKKYITQVGDKTFTEAQKPADDFKAYVGETITWKIEVTNSSAVDAPDVEVSETFKVGDAAASLTIKDSDGKDVTLNEGKIAVGLISAGTTVTYTATYTIVAADRDKTITNIAASGESSSTTTTKVSDKDAIVIEKTAKVGNKVLSERDKVSAGDTITYEIKVTNNGNRDLNNLEIVDTLTARADGKEEASFRKPTTPADVSYNETTGKTTFTITKLPYEVKANENPALITYTYKVVPADAGLYLKNIAVTKPDNGTPESKGETPEIEVNKLQITGLTKTLVNVLPADWSDETTAAEKLAYLNAPGNTVDKITVPTGNGTLTLIYKITVTGDAGANYTVTDTGANYLMGDQLSGTIQADEDGKAVPAVIYVTMGFAYEDGKMTDEVANKATVTPGDDTEGEPEAEEVLYQVSYTYDGTKPTDVEVSALPGAVLYKADATVTVADDATAAGYDFEGWWYAGPTQDELPITGTTTKTFEMPAHNVVLAGGFTIKVPVIDEVVKTFDGVVTVAEETDEVTGAKTLANAEAVTAGQTIQYSVTIKTSKDDGVVKYFSITDDKLENLTSVQIKGEDGEWADATYAHDETTGIFTLTTPTTAEIKVTYEYTVVKPTTGNQVTNTAKVQAWNTDGENPPKSNEKEDKKDIPYQDPAVTVTKTIKSIGGKDYTTGMKAEVGQTITWEIKVENTTKVPTGNLALVDVLKFNGEQKAEKDAEDEETYVSATIGSDSASFTLAGEASKTFTATYTVTKDDAGQKIVNVASVGDESGTSPEIDVETLKITSQTKVLVLHAEDAKDVEIPNGVTITYAEAGKDTIVVPAKDTSVTLLYKITVEGDKDASFTVSDEGATLIGADEDGKIEGTIPAAGEVSYYAYKTFEKNGDGVFAGIANEAKVETATGSEGPKEDPKDVRYTVTVKYIADDETDLGKADYTVIVPAGSEYDVSGEDIKLAAISVEKDGETVSYAYDTYTSFGGLVEDDVDSMAVEHPGLSDTANSDIVIVLIYSKDVVNKENPDEPGPDGIPDKYEVTVTFQIAKTTETEGVKDEAKYTGMWADETTADKKVVLLRKDAAGEFDADASVKLAVDQIPTGTPNALYGYGGDGTWEKLDGTTAPDDGTPSTTTEIKTNTTYQLGWTLQNTSYTVVKHYVARDGSEKVTEPEEKTAAYATSVGSLFEENGALYGDTKSKPVTYTYDGVTYLYDTAKIGVEAEDWDGNKLENTMTYQDIDNRIVINGMQIHLFYDIDAIGTEDPDKSDGTPDKDQIIFTYTTDGKGTLNENQKEVVTKANGAASPQAVPTPVAGEKMAFDYWTVQNGADKDFKKTMDTLKAVSYTEDTTFVAHFDKDEIGTEDPDQPDNVPDKYQVTFTYKASEGGYVYTSVGEDNKPVPVNEIKRVVTRTDRDGNPSETAAVHADASGVNQQAKENYKFVKWTSDVGSKNYGNLDQIKDDLFWNNATFTATYELVRHDLTVKYLLDREDLAVGAEDVELADGKSVPGVFTHGEAYNLESLALATIDSKAEGYTGHYVLVGSEGAIGTANSDVVIEFYYSKDEIGTENPNKPDDIPDRYQVTVHFQVNYGAWNTGSSETITRVLTLRENGVPSANGTATTTAPASGARPASGYQVGSWTSPMPETLTKNNNGATFVYAYVPIPVIPTIPFTPTPSIPGGPTGPTGTTITDNDVPLAAPGLNSTDHFDYIKGYEDGTVRPEANIKRGEVATIFFRLMTNEFRTENWSTENDFSDVSSSDWYNNAISTCVKAGILSGYPDGTFRPNQPISRAEFAAIAARFASDEVPSGGMFKDIEGHWAQESIERASAAGWIKGSKGEFRPNDSITRAEVVTTINRMLDRIPDADLMLDGMKTFPDNTPDMWWYADVQEATNSHDYERDEMGVTETWTELLPEQDWTALEKEWATAADANVADVMTPASTEEEGEGEAEAESED